MSEQTDKRIPTFKTFKYNDLATFLELLDQVIPLTHNDLAEFMEDRSR